MRMVRTIALFLAIAGATMICGCTALTELFPAGHPSPTPFPTYGPIAATPTPSASLAMGTPTPGPVVISSQSSGFVKIVLAPAEYKRYTWDRDINGQFENITFIVANDDTKPAKNVVITMTGKENTRDLTVFYQEFNIGDLARGERKQVWLKTNSHQDANFMRVHIKITWGEYREYYNPDPYNLDVTAYI